MMKIEVCLNVATVDFLRSIAGKEVVLDSTIQDNMGYLLIYPKKPIYVGAIDDIIDSEYDIAGFFNGEVKFDGNNPFKYELGIYTKNSSPFIANNDLMFELINETMEHKGFLDFANQDNFILSKQMLYAIAGVTAIITIKEDDMVAIEDVEIIEDWLIKTTPFKDVLDLIHTPFIYFNHITITYFFILVSATLVC